MAYKYFKDYREEIKKDLSELKVIYTDLDGTFFNDKGCVIRDGSGDYFLGAIKLLPDIKKKDWDIVLVSGRNKHQLRFNAQMIGIKHYIAELGAEVVYDLGREVHVTFDNKGHKHDLTSEGEDLEVLIGLFHEKFPGKMEGRMEWSRYRSYNALFFGEIDLRSANRLLVEKGYDGLDIVDNGFSNLMDLDLDVERLHIYNLIPKGVNKAKGIKLDKKIRNFKKEDCIALGDSLEDLKMANEVAYFFLMRNALEHKEELTAELKKHNNIYITEGAMNRGWFEVMEYLLQ